MFLNFLLCVTFLFGVVICGPITEDGNQDNPLEECNPFIPEDRNVDVGGECKTSLNCQQMDTECVYIRENYCECQVKEDRTMVKKWGIEYMKNKKNSCKKLEGHSCSKKSECPTKYRKRKKKCNGGRSMVCCTKCKNLKDHDCMPKKSCEKGTIQGGYQCGKKSHVCCKKKLEGCYGAPDCDNTMYCDSKSKKCECKSPKFLVNGVCVTGCFNTPPCDEKMYCDGVTKKCACKASTLSFDGGCIADPCAPTTSYFFDNTKRTWSDAQTYCNQNGGELAEFKTVLDAGTFLASFKQWKTCSGFPHRDKYWTGLRQGDTYLTYRWLNGDALDDAVKNAITWVDRADDGGVPDDEECMAVLGTTTYAYMYDQVCDTEMHAVACKRTLDG